MPVLTQKEYEEIQKKKNALSDKEGVSFVEKKVERKQKYFYFLLHPENELDNRQNFHDVIKIENREIEYKCINGMVRTDNDEVANYLVKSGYHLVKKIKEEEIKKVLNGDTNTNRNKGIFRGIRNYYDPTF